MHLYIELVNMVIYFKWQSVSAMFITGFTRYNNVLAFGCRTHSAR